MPEGPPKELEKKLLDFSNWQHVLIITLIVFGAIVAVGALTGNRGVFGVTIIIGVFLNITPQALMVYQRYRRIKEMEERFPAFLRNLNENIRSGMAFHKSVIAVSKTDYGVLSDEIKKMAHQISWGVPLDKVLIKFADRVKSSKRLYTSINIIKESFASGGEVIATLESVADSVTNLEEADKEKKSLLDQYVLLMYAISIIFVVIISVINSFLVPIFESTSGAAAASEGSIALQNPCLNSLPGMEEFICWFYATTSSYIVVNSGTEGSIDAQNIASYYTALFFWMAVVQSVLSGLVAGQISEGSVKAGIKHSIILAGITVGMFYILVQMGLLGI